MQDACQSESTLPQAQKASWVQRFLDFWMPVFNLEACVAQWAERSLSPLEAKTLRHISGEAHDRERQLHFKRAHSGLTGEHVSPFKGQGMDFAELREYAPGDDIRKLDWQVFARTQVPHIREYKEERQLTVWLVLEDTAALGLGPATYRQIDEKDDEALLPISDKRLRACELLLRLGRIAKSANAKIGFFLATENGYVVLKPSAGQAQLIRISELLFSCILDSKQSAFVPSEVPLAALQRLVLKQDWVLLVTDTTAIDNAWAKPFGLMAHHSPVNVFTVFDRREWQLPEPLQHAPLLSPKENNLRVKRQENPGNLCDALKGLEEKKQQNLKMLNSVASVFCVDVSESIEDILHHWAGHMRTPLKRAKSGGAS